MKLTDCIGFCRAIVLALALGPMLAYAQDQASALQQAQTAVAKALGRPAGDISFEGLKLIQDKLGAIVCGSANGKRFLADAAKPAGPPQIEGVLSASIFNFMWNARCRGMSAAAATEILEHEMKK